MAKAQPTSLDNHATKGGSHAKPHMMREHAHLQCQGDRWPFSVYFWGLCCANLPSTMLPLFLANRESSSNSYGKARCLFTRVWFLFPLFDRLISISFGWTATPLSLCLILALSHSRAHRRTLTELSPMSWIAWKSCAQPQQKPQNVDAVVHFESMPPQCTGTSVLFTDKCFPVVMKDMQGLKQHGVQQRRC